MRQKPDLRKIGIFVVAIAVQITISSGTAARLVRSPTSTSSPQIISTAPTNGPITCGAGIPIPANLPDPHCSGNRNFLIPSMKNTPPTSRRIARIAACVLTNTELPPLDMSGPPSDVRFVKGFQFGWSVTQSAGIKTLPRLHWKVREHAPRLKTKIARKAGGSLADGHSLRVRSHIQRFPIPPNDRHSNLGGCLSLLRQLVGEDGFPQANIALGPVRGDKAIQK